MLRVAIADDHRLFRQGLAQLLAQADGIQLVGEAANADDLTSLCTTLTPDLVIADVSMPGPPLATLITQHLQLRWIVLTMHADGGLARQLLEVGASAFVLKDSAFDDLLHAIREVGAGRSFVSSSVELPNGPPDSAPSARELEVLRLMAQGHTTKRIASIMGVSTKTIETFRARLMRKLRVQSGPELIYAASQRGWL